MEEIYNYKKIEKWKKILGEHVYVYCKEHNENFKLYLSDQLIFKCDKTKIEQKMVNKTNFNIAINLEDFCFEQFYEKIIRIVIPRLAEALKGTEEYWEETIYNDFANHLITQLQEICIRTLIVKMNEYKQQNKLKGSDVREEYKYFCENVVCEDCFIKEFLLEYPMLYYCIKDKVNNMILFYKEIINYFIADKQDIERYLCQGHKMNRIVKIHGNFSDVHNGGKQVLKVELDNGVRLCYKPHSMNNEKIYNNMLQWISKKINIKQMSYPFLTYKNHSWTTIVQHNTCENESQLENYYLRMGVQLFLVYLLGTKDLHYENIIAAGEYPVLIDLETLVTVCYNTERKTVNEEILYQLAQSVLYTGVLPYCSWNSNGTGIDNSAISGGVGGKYPFKLPVIINSKTSEMKVVYDYPSIPRKSNIATINGVFYHPGKYANEIIKGFTKAYETVMNQKDEFLMFFEQIKYSESRFLIRDTQYYSMLLNCSYHPSLLTDTIQRKIFLNVIRKMKKEENVIIAEINDLLRGDIPYFYYKVNDTALYNKQGKVQDNYFKESPLKILYDKLSALNKNDKDKQCEYIEISLGLSNSDQEYYVNRTRSSEQVRKIKKQSVEVKKIQEELLQRLLRQAVWNNDCTEVSWGVLQFKNSHMNSWTIIPMGYYMYDGLAGMLLLFYVLGKSSTDDRIKLIKNTLQRMLFAYTEKADISSDVLKSNKTGIYEGESSIVYVYLLLYKLSKDEIFLNYAKRHAQIVERLIEYDNYFDLLSGNAGATIMFINMYEITKESKYIDMAEHALGVIVEKSVKMGRGIGWCLGNEQMPMAGMAHGNAGIMMAILSLYKITKKEKYKILAKKVWEYENSLYDYTMNNWKDTRENTQTEDNNGNIAWCHGAAGILLSRIAVFGVDDKDISDLLKKDINRAYEKLRECWVRDSWCLCHGNCGNMWIIEEMKKWKGEEMKLNVNYNVKLLPQEKLNPGLMSGYGGILYYLLKKTGEHVYNILKMEI